MLRAQLLRRAMEVFGKLPDRTEIAADRGRRVVAPLKLVEHALAKWGHGNLLPMTSHPSPASLPSLTTTLSPSRQRLRSNGVIGKFNRRSASNGQLTEKRTLQALHYDKW